MKIAPVTDLAPHRGALNDMLIRTVADGASIGFHAPLPASEATTFWDAVQAQLASRQSLMLAAFSGDRLVGAVQLALADKTNAAHRAEVQKLMVHPDARGRGAARKLMLALEKLALEHNRTLLILDTILGDVAEGLYTRLGYTRVGEVPAFTIEADGSFGTTVIFFKHLTDET
jgi:GNAT superfamily N-acetyltransferase